MYHDGAAIYSTVLLTRASQTCGIYGNAPSIPPLRGFFLAFGKQPTARLSHVKSLSRHKPPRLSDIKINLTQTISSWFELG